MKIRHKLVFSSLLIAVLASTTTIFTFHSYSDIRAVFSDLTEGTALKSRALEELKVAGVEIVSTTSQFALGHYEHLDDQMTDSEENQLRVRGVDAFHNSLSIYDQLVRARPSKAEIARYAVIEVAGTNLIKTSKEIIDLRRQDISGTEVLEKRKAFEIEEVKYLGAIDEAIELESDHVAQDQKHVQSAISNAMVRTSVITILSFLFALVVGFYMSYIIGRPLGRLKEAVESLADGHLDANVQIIAKDEIGDVAKAFNKMVGELSESRKTLQESETRFRTVIESANDGIVLTDQYSRICSWNPGAESIFGYSFEEVDGQLLSFLFPSDYVQDISGDGDTDPMIASGLLHSKHRVIELKGHKKDGSQFPLEISMSSWETKDGVFYSGIIRDITSRKMMEDQLMRAQKLESIGQLAAGIAHEINTPTQYVGDNMSFLKDGFNDISPVLVKSSELLTAYGETKELPPRLISEMQEVVAKADVEYMLQEVPKALSQALDGVGRIAKIVQSMKDFAHPGSGEKKASDLNRAIESTITVASNEWKYVADLETDYDPTLPPVPCVLGKVNQVILNMIINATHAIKDVVGDGSKGKGKICISTKYMDPWAEIRITDSGGGIPEDIRKKIFDPFFTTKGVGLGTGQGLAISYAVICDTHQGTIDLESEPGLGTTFIIRLPVG